MTDPKLADILRQAKKRTLENAVSGGKDWATVSKELANYKTGKVKKWPSDGLMHCLENEQVPFAVCSDLLLLAIAEKDTKIIEKILASTIVLDDIVLVDLLLWGVQQETPVKNIVELVFQRRANHSVVVGKLRQIGSIDVSLQLLEAACELLQNESYNVPIQIITSWVHAIIDAHFMGFTQRLGFCSEASDQDETKRRLVAVINRLSSFIDDYASATEFCSNMLEVVELTMALVANRLPNPNRYRDQNHGKVHRDYAYRLITL